MINVLGWQVFAGFIVALTIACGAAAFIFNGSENLLEFFGLFSKAGLTVSLVVLGIGQSAAFAWLCKYPPLNFLVPDVHGQWRGAISSNWPLIARANDIRDKDGNTFEDTPTPVTANICVKLLSISIELKSDSGYQKSQTLNCRLAKNSHSGFEFSYIYKSTVTVPKKTDEQGFYGAGIIDFADRKPTELIGVYWTNRNWQEGLNPAGVITLTKA